MGNWYSLNPNQLIPGPVLAAAQGVSKLLSDALGASALLGEAISAIETKAQGLLSSSLIPDPAKQAAKLLLDALQAIVAGSKVHLLVVPVQKTFPAPRVPTLPATTDDLRIWLNSNLGVPQSTAQAYQQLMQNTGGNAGFYRAVSQSMLDLSDPNRPVFVNDTDAVTMAVVMAGSAAFHEITHAASVLNQLLQSKTDLMARTIPVPQNVTAKPVAAPGVPNAPRVAVRVDWDPPKAAIKLPYFPGLGFAVKRYALVRSTDPKARTARSVLDLFTTQDLSTGMTNKSSKVVSVGTGSNSTFVDTDSSMDTTVPQYYAVAWEVEIQEAAAGGGTTTTTHKFDRLSAVVKVSPVAPPPAQTGTPPDWQSLGAAQDIFPAVSTTIEQILARAEVLLTGRPSPTSRTQDALAVGKAAADRLTSRAQDLLIDLQGLQTALQRPVPELHVTRVTGLGGNAFLLTELARRLQDTTDPDRPPFDHGEYVCGIVVVAGAPRLGDLQAAIAFLDSLFGPAAASNPLLAVLNAVNTAVTETEVTLFGTDMQPLPAGTVVVPPVPTPVINDAGTPVTVDDPTNPNAGITGNVNPQDLC